MNLDGLRAFLAVAETGSFFTAARQLKLSRATLRRRVDELEVQAGVPLLERTRLGASVTEAGALLAARGRLIVQEASTLLATVHEIGAAPSGIVRAMLPVGLPPHLLTPVFAMLSVRYPRLTFRVRFGNDPVERLLEDVDLAVHFGTQSPAGPWLSHELLRVRVWLLASKDYLARRGTPRSIEDLARHDLFAWEMPREDGHLWPIKTGGTFTVTPKLLSPEIHWLRQCVIAGLGMALIPDVMLPDPGLPPDALVPVLPDLIGRDLAVRMVVPAALAQIPKIKAVLDVLQPFLAAHTPDPPSIR